MAVAKRCYGVDVANYQPSSMAGYHSAGAKFAIVKLTEGVGYINPKAKQQIASAKSHGMLAMGYFFATYSANAMQAKRQAEYAISRAKAVGLPHGSYIAVDWETGDGNSVWGSVAGNTDAALTAMATIHGSGYKPLIYSGAANLRSRLDLHRIVRAFGNCIWVASYAIMGRIDRPNFGYFPSMDGVAIWQFTDNWKGLGVDGNINLVELSGASSKSSGGDKVKQVSLHPVLKWNIGGVAVVANSKGAYIYTSPKLGKRESSKTKPQGSAWAVLGIDDGAVKVGKNQYFDGRAVYVKLNPIAYNSKKHAVAKIVEPHTHALAEPKADAKKVYGLALNSKVEVRGRVGRFLKIKKPYKGKPVYVTGNRAYIIL